MFSGLSHKADRLVMSRKYQTQTLTPRKSCKLSRWQTETCYYSGMAKKEFILQGLTTSTHIDVVRRLFALPGIQKVLMSVAFITEGGVELIEAQLMAHATRVTVFAGVRNDTTSYQGLVRLHGLVRELY